MTEAFELSPAAEQLLPALDALSTKDQEGLLQYILARLDGPPDDPAEVRKAWKAEILRRVAEIDSGKVVGVPIEEMFRKSRERHP
jgi:putative addiction module component (TIGR02574 family)